MLHVFQHPTRSRYRLRLWPVGPRNEFRACPGEGRGWRRKFGTSA